MIEALQVHVLNDHYVVKVRFTPGTKKLDKRQLKRELHGVMDAVRNGTEKADTGGGRGFWHNGRLEELVIERRGEE